MQFSHDCYKRKLETREEKKTVDKSFHIPSVSKSFRLILLFTHPTLIPIKCPERSLCVRNRRNKKKISRSLSLIDIYGILWATFVGNAFSWHSIEGSFVSSSCQSHLRYVFSLSLSVCIVACIEMSNNTARKKFLLL